MEALAVVGALTKPRPTNVGWGISFTKPLLTALKSSRVESSWACCSKENEDMFLELFNPDGVSGSTVSKILKWVKV
jgi:hypothetical protein